MPEQACRICGDTEPHHVHNGDKRIENYFTVGRGQTDFEAASSWKRKFFALQAQLRELGKGEVVEDVR